MTRTQQLALVLFSAGLIGLGFLALIYGDFALVWQPVAAWVPGRTALAYASGVLMLVCGVGLLFKPTAAWSVRILFPYLILWALLKVPALVVAPQIEGVWLGFGELAVLLSGGWVLFARMAALKEGSKLAFAAGDSGVRIARIFFALWVIPIGLSHFFYLKETVSLVPAWLPVRAGWAWLTGAGHIACGLAVLFSVVPRLAATMEAAMIGVFALLVWGPKISWRLTPDFPGLPSSFPGSSPRPRGLWRTISPVYGAFVKPEIWGMTHPLSVAGCCKISKASPMFFRSF